MSNNNFHKTIVKIIAHNVTNDWYAPFRSPYENESIGSGFFFKEGGYILTCCHVIEDAIKLEITIPSEGKHLYSAKVISMSPDYDIAVIQTTYDNKESLNIFDSDNIKQGDLVNAVGYPLGQDKLKVSQGIISGYQNHHFQTDAPINPGNSGGPLVDINNNVIGINSQKISSNVADNIGYSVPIKYFSILYDFFLPKETLYPKIIRHPRLLCQFSQIDNLIKEYYNMDNDGYLISKIHENSCLYKAGLRVNDILMEFGEYKLDKFGEVNVPWNNEKFNIKDILYRFKIDEQINITYFNKDVGISNVQVTLDYPDFIIKDVYLNLFNQKIDHEILSGLVFCNFRRNHLYQYQIGPQTNIDPNLKNKLLDYKDNDTKRFESKIILVNILPGSYTKSNSDVNAGIFLNKVNDIKVTNIDELRKNIINNNDKFIKLSFSNDQIIIMTNDIIKSQYEILSKQYNFKATPILQFLLGKYSIPYSLKKINKYTKLSEVENNMQDMRWPTLNTYVPTIPMIENQENKNDIIKNEKKAYEYIYPVIS
jgi:S1-C subfamily serine protease